MSARDRCNVRMKNLLLGPESGPITTGLGPMWLRPTQDVGGSDRYTLLGILDGRAQLIKGRRLGFVVRE